MSPWKHDPYSEAVREGKKNLGQTAHISHDFIDFIH